jgi:sarcosine oxidase subunit alpha
MATIAGRNRGQLYAPVRRLPGEIAHRQDAACLREYGGILRPAWYGTDGSAIAAECLAARQETAIFDASSLGKIEVIGPDAARFLDFICYSRMSTLVPGRMRYTLMLTEGGVIFDDGVVLRLSEESFVVSCSSSHVAAIGAHLEEWRQDRFERARVFIHDATSHWATLAIVGPGSRALVTTLGLGIAVDDAALPHMAMRSGEFQGKAARVARVSFTGERSYEVSVPASFAARLWHKARELGARPIGVEALSILRAEKGYVIVGQDTDGETMPHDIGMPGPRDKREDAYVGDRSLFTPAAKREGRRQLVGILADGGGSIPAGAHAIDPAREHQRGLGYVTSSFRSPSLGHGIALGLIENGRARIGQSVVFEHLGRRLSGRVVAPCFMDPEGRRLHV